MCYNVFWLGSDNMADYKVGDIIEVQVIGITNYGIFVSVGNDYKGLIHISEVSNHYVKDILDYVSVDEKILCEVLDVDDEQKHLRLSIKNINYKLVPKFGKIKDTVDGFKALQMKLPVWTREKLKEIEAEKF